MQNENRIVKTHWNNLIRLRLTLAADSIDEIIFYIDKKSDIHIIGLPDKPIPAKGPTIALIKYFSFDVSKIN